LLSFCGVSFAVSIEVLTVIIVIIIIYKKVRFIFSLLGFI